MELLVSHRMPPRVADRGMLARYGGYQGDKIPGADQTLRLTEGSVKARGRKPRKKIAWSSRLGVVRRASYPSMENICKLKTLNEGMELNGKRSLRRPKLSTRKFSKKKKKKKDEEEEEGGGGGGGGGEEE